MSQKTIIIEGIPQKILLRRSPRIKRFSIRISGSAGIVVLLPFLVSERKALKIINEKRDWILGALKKIAQKFPSKILQNEIPWLKGTIRFQEIEHNVIKIQRELGDILISIPKTENQEILRKSVLLEFLRKEAKDFLPGRVAHLAQLHNFSYGKLSLRHQKTIWGSCSSQNNISLNIMLMMLPLELADYVIIHELCHTVHKNHSKDFWDLVSENLKTPLHICKEKLKKHTIYL